MARAYEAALPLRFCDRLIGNWPRHRSAADQARLARNATDDYTLSQ